MSIIHERQTVDPESQPSMSRLMRLNRRLLERGFVEGYLARANPEPDTLDFDIEDLAQVVPALQDMHGEGNVEIVPAAFSPRGEVEATIDVATVYVNHKDPHL